MAGDEGSAIGLYVHVPFCESKCTYCHFAIDHSAADARRAVEDARNAGFENLNLDLILGWPGETRERWMRQLDGFFALEPDHVSIYVLEVEGRPRRAAVERGLPGVRVGTPMLLKVRSEDVADADEQSRQREGPGSQGALVCARCRNLVTSRASAISMGGSHAHTFANPHGFEFRIGCFADAPGCREVGEESAYWTWFPGFTWRVSLCGHCGGHLGWLFRSPDARFFGLILDHLIQAD